MKKLIVLLSAFVMMFALVACDSDSSNSSNEEEQAVESTEEAKNIVIYSYDLEKEDFFTNDVKVDEVNEDTVFTEFVKLSPSVSSAKLNSFEVSDVDGVKTGYLDISSGFLNPDMDETEEMLLLECIIFTFTDNFDVEQISISIDGNPYESNFLFIGPDDFLDEDTIITDFERSEYYSEDDEDDSDYSEDEENDEEIDSDEEVVDDTIEE